MKKDEIYMVKLNDKNCLKKFYIFSEALEYCLEAATFCFIETESGKIVYRKAYF